MGILGTNDDFADGIEFVELSADVIVIPAASVEFILVMAFFLQR
jgi:hypothetical protein